MSTNPYPDRFRGPAWTICTESPDGTVYDIRDCGSDEEPGSGERKDYWPEGKPRDKAVWYTPEARERELERREADTPEGQRKRIAALEAEKLPDRVSELEAK